ncbi:hypothetical protein HDU76_008121, partial [Blyttiomyces sp. JEL0837]
MLVRVMLNLGELMLRSWGNGLTVLGNGLGENRGFICVVLLFWKKRFWNVWKSWGFRWRGLRLKSGG